MILKSIKTGEYLEYGLTLRDRDMEWSMGELFPGSYSVRAAWMFVDCEEEEGNDSCLPPKQNITITSNELNVRSPEIKERGEIKLSFQVRAEPSSKENRSVDSAEFRGPSSDLETTLFHYVIRNLGQDPLRNEHLDCGDPWITPEYQVSADDWKPLPVNQSHYEICTLNMEKIQTILPGETAEGEFRFSTLMGVYDTTSLEPSGGHLRFILRPNTCVASDDGSFCLTRWANGKKVLSNPVNVTAKVTTTSRSAPLP